MNLRERWAEVAAIGNHPRVTPCAETLGWILLTEWGHDKCGGVRFGSQPAMTLRPVRRPWCWVGLLEDTTTMGGLDVTYARHWPLSLSQSIRVL